MKGRVFVAALAALAAAPSVAAAYPDWRSPAAVGVPQEGVLRFPQALAYDASGVDDPGPGAPRAPYVYVADQHSFWVQKFTADGHLVRRFGGYGSDPGHLGSTSASASPTTGVVGGVGGMAVDERGRVYVLDSSNNRIERFSPGGEFQSQWGTPGAAPGQLNLGINGGIALSGEFLYVADQDNHRVQRFHLGADGWPDGTPPLVYGSFGTGAGQFNFVQDVGVDPARDHDVFAADDRNDRVHRLTAGLALKSFIGAPGDLDAPYAAAMDLAGRLFVADNAHMRVARFDDGVFKLGFGGPGVQPGQLNNVRSVAVAPNADAAGGVFATNTSLNDISEFGVDGAFIRRWGEDGRGPRAFMQPRDVAVEANGDIIVVDTRADRVQVLRADGDVETWARISAALGTPTSGTGPREFLDPNDAAIDPRNGDVWVVEGGRHRVQRIPQDGDKTKVTIYGGNSAGNTPGRFTEPLGVAVAADGTVWVADTRNDRLQRLDRATDTWSMLGGFVRPTAVAVLTDGRIAVTELDGRLTLLTPDGTRVASVDGFHNPEGVASDGHGGVLVSDTQDDRVLHFNAALAPLGKVGSGWTRPMGMDLDPSGRLLVADTYANRVLRLDPADSQPSGAGGTVAPALALLVGEGGRFDPFTPGVARTYTTTVAADVLSTAGDATLAVSDPSTSAPGHLVNGAYTLAQPLLVAGAPLPATVKTWAVPVSHDPVTIALSQTIGANEPLRTGAYAKTLTFTLSTTAP
jgi:sugar lactone lactonase YvrE